MTPIGACGLVKFVSGGIKLRSSVNKRLRAAGVVAVCGLGILSAGAANASIVIDQSNLVDVTKGIILGSGIGAPQPGSAGVQQVQTITAGLEGTLARIDLQVYRPGGFGAGELQATVYSGDFAMAQGVAGGTAGGFAAPVGVVASFAVPTEAEAQAGQLLSFDTTGLNFHVEPGQVFSVLLSVTHASGDIVGWAYGYQPDPNDFNDIFGLAYAGGYNSREYDGGNFVETTYDRGFQTAVDVGGVPEPSIWALMLVGFGGVGALMRRRHGNAARLAS